MGERSKINGYNDLTTNHLTHLLHNFCFELEHAKHSDKLLDNDILAMGQNHVCYRYVPCLLLKLFVTK